MKLTSALRRTSSCFVAKSSSLALATVAMLAFATAAHAASSTWNITLTGSNQWATASDWVGSVIPGAAAPSTTNTDTATFNATSGAQTIGVDSGRNIGSIVFAPSSTFNAIYTFLSATSGANGSFVLSSGGSITVNSGNQSSIRFQTTPLALAGNYSFTDNTVIPAGTLAVSTAANSGNLWFGENAFGGGTGTAGFISGVANKGAITLTLNGTRGAQIPGVYQQYQAGQDVIGSQITNGTGNTLSIVKSGIGTWVFNETPFGAGLPSSNNYSGSTTIDGGILGIYRLSIGGTNSSIGNSSSAASNLIFNGGTLQVNSDTETSSGPAGWQNGQSTDRLFTIGDASSAINTATIDASNWQGTLLNTTAAKNATNDAGAWIQLGGDLVNSTAGTVTFSNTGAIVYGGSSGNHGLTLTGQNLGNNTFSLGIQDGGGGVTSLTKSGPGTWVLNGTSNGYSGATTITGGVLRDAAGGNGVSANSSVVLNGGTYESATNITRTLGTAATNLEILGGQSGFSAFGGAVTVTLNNGGNPLKFGTATFNPSQFILNAPTANNALTLTNGLDLNGASQTIATYANTATISGVISNSVTPVSAVAPALYKIGGGTLVLANTNTYAGGTVITQGTVSGTAQGAFGTGSVTAYNGGEVRIAALNDIASGQKVTLNNGTLGLAYNAQQSDITGLLTSGSTGIIALDGAQSNALNMATIGNGGLFLGSSTAGTYSAATLGITPGGTAGTVTSPLPGTYNNPAIFGNAYNLGGGGGTLTFTSSVLKDQTQAYLATNTANALSTTAYSDSAVYSATSNTRNRLVVGDGSTNGNPNGGGTVNLQATQSYSNTTTVNAGGTLQLDYSTGTAGTGNIISSSSPVTLTGGTLAVLGNASAADTQTLGGVSTTLGGSTITNNSNGASGANGSTLNLGTINAPLAYGVANYTTVGTGSTLLLNQTGTNANTVITTTTAPVNSIVGAGQYVYNNNGTYGWASSSSAGPTYTLTNYASETSLGTTPVNSATTDYVISSSGTITQTGNGNTMNLLRLSNNTGTFGKLAPAANAALSLNGILNTGNTSETVGVSTNSIKSPNGNLYLQNFGTGTLAVDANFISNMNVIYGGTGVINHAGSVADNYTGNTYLDGAILNLNGWTQLNGTHGTFVINSGAISIAQTSSPQLVIPTQINGNFSLGSVGGQQNAITIGSAYGQLGQFGNITLTTTPTITIANAGKADWNYTGQLTDGGYGYGLTIAGNNQYLANFGNVAAQTNPINGFFILAGTNQSTGPVTVLGAGVGIANVAATNRNTVLALAPNTNALLGGVANNFAGIVDAGAPSQTEYIANLSTNPGTIVLWGSGMYSYGGTIANGYSTVALTQNGTGTQTLTGSNSFTGVITVNAGTLAVDASLGGGAILSGANTLTLGGGTFKLKGDPTTQNLGYVNATAGGSAIVVDSSVGATTLNLGAMASLGSAIGSTVNIAAVGSNSTITELSGNTQGTLGVPGKVTYTSPTGVTTWAVATTSGSTNTIGAYTGDTTALVTSGVNNNQGTYNLTGSQTQTAGSTVDLLRISNGGTAGTLGMGGKILSASGILFNGSSNYAIGSSVGDGSLVTVNQSGLYELPLQNFGTNGATLTINSVITDVGATHTGLTISGPGTTVLTASNTYSGVTYLNNGTINFNKLANFGTGTGATGGIQFYGGTLQYATGNTTDLTAATGQKTITFNAPGGTIDTNGNTVTYANAFGTGVGGVTFVDTASVHGTLNINNSTGYTGVTTIGNGGNVNLGNNGNLNAGSANVTGTTQTADSGTVIASRGTLSGGTTQATNTTQGTATAGTGNNNAGRITLQSGGVLKPGDFTAGVTLPNGAGDGNFFGNQPPGAAHNVMNAQQLTWNAGGTLSFQLNSASQQGSATNPSASTTLNLGTGAFVKSGTGLFVLNFNNTGNYNTTGAFFGNLADYTNVYDLVNFGATSLTGGINGNTNFNIDDFSIINLNGIGTLSFYYNPYADGAIGQEELLLTVVPEPSTWAMLLGGLVALVFWTRKRSRKTSFRKI